MCLTEPTAGSDLGALKTKAVRQADGTYLITGQKIFISNGEHDMTENIIHPVLARIEGDPEGTKGISIFVVPKFLINPDGTLGARNDMILRRHRTQNGTQRQCHLDAEFRRKRQVRRLPAGQGTRRHEGHVHAHERRPHPYRGSGRGGIQRRLHACRQLCQRTAFRAPISSQSMNKAAPKVAIIEHPDVKRMLLYMKSTIEGMRMLCYFLCLS